MNFSWVDMNIAASAYLWDRENIEYVIEKHGINVIINLSGNSYDNPYPDKLELIDHKIHDFGTPTEKEMNELLQLIQKKIEEKKKILIHCVAGCGRTGMVIAIYKISKQPNKNREEIINELRQLRPCSIDNQEQYEFVLNFQLDSQNSHKIIDL